MSKVKRIRSHVFNLNGVQKKRIIEYHVTHISIDQRNTAAAVDNKNSNNNNRQT